MNNSQLHFIALFSVLFCLFYGLILIPKNSRNYQVLSLLLVTLFVAKLSWSFANFLWNKLKFIPKELIPPTGKAVLITGCDTGFGHILAKRLNKYGFYVFAGCLFPEGEGATQLSHLCPNNLQIIKLDVTKDEDVTNAYEEVKESIGDRKLWAIVNNAGILISAEIEMGDIQCFTSQMDVNCIGIIRVTKKFLPLLRKARGRVVNMASLAGRFAIPGMVGYCVSKAAVISFSNGLRREMKKWDIDVIAIEPHLFKTNLCDEKSQKSALNNAWNCTSEEVRRDYGDQYFEGYERVLDMMLGSARTSISDVVDTMSIAVTHQFVAAYYPVLGPLERIRVSLYNTLPIRVLDSIGDFIYTRYTGKPKMICDVANVCKLD